MTRHSLNRPQTVAIIGGGPAAGTLAILLIRAGFRVALWHKPKAATLIVGESLVPALIPILRQLGIEDEVRKYSVLKPGATFNLAPDLSFSFFFEALHGLPRYAYNVPREKFDATLLAAARKAGAAVFESPAQLTAEAHTDRVALTPETLAATNGYFSGQPDWIVDATGRFRLLPNLLGLSSQEGKRKDTALFAHVDHAHLDHEGHVHTTRMDRGWSWRIPLPGRVSLGMVVPSEHLPQWGATPEDQYDGLCQHDSQLRRVAGHSRRLTPVMKYTSYQLVSERMFGANWALVGDTAGFVDPVFSSGLFLGMNGAFLLARALAKGSPEALQQYERESRHHLQTWQNIVEYWYNGRLFTCFKVGQKRRDTLLVKLIFPHMNKHMGRVFAGAASHSAYSIGLLRFAMKYGLEDENPEDLKVR
ncbi:MAG TPA: tryptophan 7-halogenase [Verrucomicrobiota bacterium]|nr:tryptophan 7-halogenase [Verrucomicrobiota bacterium]